MQKFEDFVVHSVVYMLADLDFALIVAGVWADCFYLDFEYDDELLDNLPH